MQTLSIVLIYFVVLVANGFCDNPIITINDGDVMGISNQTIELGTTYYSFRGIPYAKPPTGNLRFKSPVKPDSWNGTLNATVDGADCIQVSDGEVIGSEDCLFINVYTPDTTLKGNLPVMVWIYGGSFTTGSGSYANHGPDYLIEEEVVYVSFNYRLGSLGWLSTEDKYCPGNFGMKDQILALKWIQNNIAHFGGDPNNVTIFGESAGAASCAYLLQSNWTEGLFKGAIMESGTSLNGWALQTNPSNHAFNLGIQLGIITTDSKTLMEKLLDKDAKDIVTAADTVYYLVFLNNVFGGLPWGPVVEPWSNESAFSGKSHDLLSAGNFRRVPLIVGYNSFELGAIEEYELLLPLVLAIYDFDYAKIAPYSLSTSSVTKLTAGIKIKHHYFKLLSMGVQPKKVISWATSDQFNRPIREFVDTTSKFTDVYYYRFNYVGDLGGTIDNRAYWGVTHTEELNYIFVSDNNSTANDTIVRKRMVKMWCNFAKYSSPQYSTDQTLFSSSSTSKWTPARLRNAAGTLAASSDLSYMKITSSLRMASNPNQTDYEFYRDNIFAVYGKGSYTTY